MIAKAKKIVIKRELLKETRKQTKLIDFKPNILIKGKSSERIRGMSSKVELIDTPYQKLRNLEDRKKYTIISKIKDSQKINSGLKLKNQYKTVDNNNFYFEIVNQLSVSGEIKYCPTISSLDPNLTIQTRKNHKEPKLFFNHVKSERTRNSIRTIGNVDFLLNVFTPKKSSFNRNFKESSINSTDHLSMHFQVTEDSLPQINTRFHQLQLNKNNKTDDLSNKVLAINSSDNIEFLIKK
jgi:hypothetical protein